MLNVRVTAQVVLQFLRVCHFWIAAATPGRANFVLCASFPVWMARWKQPAEQIWQRLRSR
eukprot:scaffold4309_cov215-Pinguiococcus_pyrenoidosus.AAC.1